MKAKLKITLSTEVELTIADKYTNDQMAQYAAGFAEGIRRSVAEIHGTEVTAKWDVIWKPPPRNVHCANRPGHHQPKPE
jgi:hypothetical protein